LAKLADYDKTWLRTFSPGQQSIMHPAGCWASPAWYR